MNWTEDDYMDPEQEREIEAQLNWLAAHPQYGFPGPPKPGPRFHECGTLYADGRFELMAPMKAVKLEPGCRLVGIPGDLYLTGEPNAAVGPAVCAKCGCETGGEVALVQGAEWCHPCADQQDVIVSDVGTGNKT